MTADGYSPLLGPDCNDLDAEVHPGAFDWPDDDQHDPSKSHTSLCENFSAFIACNFSRSAKQVAHQRDQEQNQKQIEENFGNARCVRTG